MGYLYLPNRLSTLIIDVDKDWDGKNITNVGTLQGQRELIAVVESLGKQVLLPPGAGDDALVVRDAGDTVDRAKIKEDGSTVVKEITVG